MGELTYRCDGGHTFKLPSGFIEGMRCPQCGQIARLLERLTTLTPTRLPERDR